MYMALALCLFPFSPKVFFDKPNIIIKLNKMRVTSSLSIYAYGCGCGRGRGSGIYSFCGCVSIWWKKKKLYYTSHPYVSTLIQ